MDRIEFEELEQPRACERLPLGFLTLLIPTFRFYPRFNKRKEYLTFSKDV